MSPGASAQLAARAAPACPGKSLTGLGYHQRQLEEVSAAIRLLDQKVARLRFNRSDPSSIAVAIREVEEAVIAKLAPFGGNVLVQAVTPQIKQSYCSAIRRRAAVAVRSMSEERTDFQKN